jgi:hypothetical protein
MSDTVVTNSERVESVANVETAKCQEKEKSSTFLLLFISSALVLVAYIIAELSNYLEISRNWSEYRCVPSITPFAKFYGHDLSETMNFCMSQAVREHASGIIDPIYSGIDKITGVVDGVYTKVEGISAGVAGLLLNLEKFIQGFMNSFRLIGVRVRMSFIKMKNIMDRIHSIFVAVAFAGMSAITFGENLVCNPLVTFMGEIAGADVCCFAPHTLIQMENGSTKPISSITINDVLASGIRVTSTFVFNGIDTQMVTIHGVHISSNHYVMYDNRMISADEHPDAIPAHSLPLLWCLSTSTHTIPVVGLVCADFEESSDPRIVAEVQQIANTLLNSQGPTVPEYVLGLDPDVLVNLADGGWRNLSDIRIGESLAGGGIVTGVVDEFCPSANLVYGPICVSDAQLVKVGGSDSLWGRAGNVWKRTRARTRNEAETETGRILKHLFVSTNEYIVRSNDVIVTVRDYAESSDDAMQAPYDREIRELF